MSIPTMQQMLEAGVHFGHQEKRWNPKMRRYIFMARNGIHIIDLKKTRQLLEEAANLVSKTVASGKSVLFVSTKKQGREVVREQAERCGQYYMTERWLGGTLTNYRTVFRSIERLKALEKSEKEGFPPNLTKREILQRTRELARLRKYLSGIRNMKGMPGVVIVVDIKNEQIAVREARKLGIPCVGLLDTNCDPTEVDYPIPGNDDAIKSISLIVSTLADYALLAREGKDSGAEKPEKAEEKASKKKATEEKASKKKATEEKAAEEKAPKKKASEKKATEEKAPEKKASKKKASEKKASKKKASEKKAEEEKSGKASKEEADEAVGASEEGEAKADDAEDGSEKEEA